MATHAGVETDSARDLVGDPGQVAGSTERGLLANRGFIALFGSNLGHGTGMQLRLMAQAWLILELGGSQLWVGAATGMRVFPAIVLSIIAGAAIDRFGGKLVLLWDRAILLVLAGITAIVVITGVVQLWHIVLLSVLSGSVIALGMPAANTLVARLVEKKYLQQANSVNQLAFTAANSIGPLVGALLISGLGIGAPFLALIGAYAIAVIATSIIPRRPPEETDGQNPLQRIREGIAYTWKTPVLRLLMFMALSLVFALTLGPVVPVYARDVLKVGAAGLGWMFAINAAGAGVSAVWITRRGGFARRGRAAVLAAVLYATAMIVFAFSRSFPLSLAMEFASGFAVPIWISSVITLIQQTAEPSKLGRVMGIYSISLQTAFFGWAVGGWLGPAIGNEAMLTLMALIFIAINLGAYAKVKLLRTI